MAEQVKKKIIGLDEGLEVIGEGIAKLERILEGEPQSFTTEESTLLYSTIYDMSTQKPPHDYSPQLYDKYNVTYVDYINSIVLPSLRVKHDEFMLKELVKRWANHNIMVYQELKIKARDAVIALIDQEREGEYIDRALLKNVLDFFVEIGMGRMEYYRNDFEDAMLKDTAAFYARKASKWIVEDSCPDYMLKAEECLKKEKERVSHYLHPNSEAKLLEKVQNELLVVYANQLLENEHSGLRALLRDDEREDLSRMYRLFQKIPKGLDLVANMFKEHVTAEGLVLVRQAKDASHSKVFVQKVTKLHAKYTSHVTECFSNNSLFLKVSEIRIGFFFWLFIFFVFVCF
ncbi:hypothetical protein DM860_012683 [Cuscuta australis]|uniref:Cullin N-terminal domain-containing protein n=1 Tax=Cuscuta australis TaxID=267555 RepID=A0A328DCH6_9ASTE|nr:hypothetical protein DM860_012683 [Cuscuta australis]